MAICSSLLIRTRTIASLRLLEWQFMHKWSFRHGDRHYWSVYTAYNVLWRNKMDRHHRIDLW